MRRNLAFFAFAFSIAVTTTFWSTPTASSSSATGIRASSSSKYCKKRFLIRCDAFPVRALKEAIENHLTHHNEKPKPFVWTASADAFLDKIKRFANECQRHDTLGPFTHCSPLRALILFAIHGRVYRNPGDRRRVTALNRVNKSSEPSAQRPE